MGNTDEIGFGERATVTDGKFAGKIAEVEEYFPGPDGGHYYVYVEGVFTAIPAKYLERL
jgi:hypothetical protein